MTAVTSTGAPTDSYSYDLANRLLAISRSNGDNVCLIYDQANRRTALVYPAGNTVNYSWDSLSDASQIAYTANGSFAPGSGGHPSNCTPGTQTGTGTGNLTYGYDQDGRQIARGGSYFTLLPPSPFAAGLASYNADNQQTMWNGLTNIFDADGDLTCTGSQSQSQSLSFDARQRLVTASGGLPALEAQRLTSMTGCRAGSRSPTSRPISARPISTAGSIRCRRTPSTSVPAPRPTRCWRCSASGWTNASELRQHRGRLGRGDHRRAGLDGAAGAGANDRSQLQLPALR